MSHFLVFPVDCIIDKWLDSHQNLQIISTIAALTIQYCVSKHSGLGCDNAVLVCFICGKSWFYSSLCLVQAWRIFHYLSTCHTFPSCWGGHLHSPRSDHRWSSFCQGFSSVLSELLLIWILKTLIGFNLGLFWRNCRSGHEQGGYSIIRLSHKVICVIFISSFAAALS